MDFITIFVLFFSPPSSFPVFSHVVPSHPKRNSTPSIPLLVHSRCYQESNDSSGGQWSDTRRRIIVTPGFYAEAIFVLITALSVESKRGEEERIKKALTVCRKCVCEREGCGEGDKKGVMVYRVRLFRVQCCLKCFQDFRMLFPLLPRLFPPIPSVTLCYSHTFLLVV